MTYAPLGMDRPWLQPATPAPPPYDYLTGGSGYLELQRIASAIATALATGKSGSVPGLSGGGPIYVTADPIISAIWGGDLTTVALFAQVMVSTICREQRSRPSAQRSPVATVAATLVSRLTTAMRSGGDPSLCMIAFEESVNKWTSLYPAMQTSQSSTGWCQRDLVFGSDCGVQALCLMTIDAKGNQQIVSTGVPPRGSVTLPPAPPATPQKPPTHAQIDAQVEAQMAASGETFEQMERVQELTELATYLNAMKQARIMFTLALGLPTNATDDIVWKALAARGIQPDEAIDWFLGCDADLDCFRQRMNTALGETDTEARNAKSKTVIALGVLGAAAFAYFRYRRR